MHVCSVFPWLCAVSSIDKQVEFRIHQHGKNWLPYSSINSISCRKRYTVFGRNTSGLRRLNNVLLMSGILSDEETDDDGMSSSSAAFDDNSQNVIPFQEMLRQVGGLPEESCTAISEKLVQVGLLAGRNDGPENLLLIAKDFVDRPEIFSSLLKSDFEMSPLMAHQVRSVVMMLLKSKLKRNNNQHDVDTANENSNIDHLAPKMNIAATKQAGEKKEEQKDDLLQIPVKQLPFKSVVVNHKAKQRKSQLPQSSSSSQSSSLLLSSNDYGLPPKYEKLYPTIASELNDFYSFMTQPATSSQEEPIRPATASVYMRHAKQFIGWYAATYNITIDSDTYNTGSEENDGSCQGTNRETLSLNVLFPTKEKESADAVLNFILWLRSSRNISVSYEANILRGLTKLLKFRFSKESLSDPSYGDKSFDDIPMIREIRKLHRLANNRQRLAPRSSDEKQKWLSWPEYLQVVQQIQKELVSLMDKHIDAGNSSTGNKPISRKNTADIADGTAKESVATCSPEQRMIATLYQKYLVLAIFSSVPDRQRTIRELAIGGNFQKDEESGCWCIKHAPEDYKTGKAYGERPHLLLAEPLTPWIDNFIANWRQCLFPKSETLFVQPRTGNALTQDSVYQIVSRACYQYSGKRTNPHLLRDMLVTHVRESNASEKQLEALALYMGHSIQMQRSSYDRRTLTKKVAPAVELLQTVNGQLAGRKNSK